MIETPRQTDPFTLFMRRVDRILLFTVGLTHEDLADYDYRDYFDAGMSPRDAAREVLAEEGYEDEEDGE